MLLIPKANPSNNANTMSRKNINPNNGSSRSRSPTSSQELANRGGFHAGGGRADDHSEEDYEDDYDDEQEDYS